MNRKGAALLLPLAAVVLVSGCTELPFISQFFPPAVKYTNDVIAIKSLAATPGTVFPGQSVRLTAYIQNLGKEERSDIIVNLYDYCKGTFIIEDTSKDIYCGGAGGTVSGESGCKIEKLYPYEIREIRWTLKADDDISLQTTCPADGVKVLVNYGMKSEGVSTISLINEGELQRQMADGTFREKQSSIVAGEGPIKGYMRVEDRQPVTVNDMGGSTVISFQLKNEGGGFLAFGPGEDRQGRPAVSLEDFDMPDGFVIKGDQDRCRSMAQGSGKFELINKESPKAVCEVDIKPEFGSVVSKESSYIMDFRVAYNYEFRASAKITVKPKAL